MCRCKIGEGSFGVHLCIKSSELINSAKGEQQFGYVSKLNSPNLVKYYEIFTFNNDLYVVMQYFENGN
jgi:serine/threonine protein kinase